MLNNLGLGIILEAKDEFSAVMDKAKGKFSEVDKAAENLTSVFGAVTKTLAIAAAGFAVIGTAAYGTWKLAGQAGEFEHALMGVAAVSRATADEMKELRDTAIQAGIATQYSPVQATLGLRELAQAGYSAKESMQLLTPVLDLAAGSLGELSPQAAAGLAAQTLKAFGIEADKAGLAMDRMLQTVNMFALTPGEMPLALGIASRGAVVLKQTLSETLIALGLTKNIIPTVERASTSIAVTMERLTSPKVQKAMAGLGVHVLDATGRFRPFLDIMNELAPALERIGPAKAGAFLSEVLGAHAMAGMVAVTTQLTNGFKTANGQLLKGKDAVAYLRGQFENASGAAHEFSSKMLSTFEGQKLLLKGTLQTLAIELGTPLAEVFAPAVKLVTTELNKMVAAMGSKEGAWGSFTNGAHRASLAIQAMLQLFEQGGFSGKVLEEMDKAENAGIQKFAIKVWHWTGLLEQVWDWLVDAWTSSMDILVPAFAGLSEQFFKLTTALGITGTTADESASAWEKAGKVGIVLGEAIAWVASAGMGALTLALDFASQAVEAFRDGWTLLGPVLKPVLLFMYDGLLAISGLLDLDLKKSLQSFAAMAVDAFGFLLGMVNDLLKILVSAVDWVGRLFGADLGLGASVGKQLDAALAEVARFRESLVGSPSVDMSGPVQTQIAPSDGGLASMKGGEAAYTAAAMAGMMSRAETHGQSRAAAIESIGTSELTSHIHVHLDGEKVGQAIHKANLRKKARAFEAIPVGQE